MCRLIAAPLSTERSRRAGSEEFDSAINVVCNNFNSSSRCLQTLNTRCAAKVEAITAHELHSRIACVEILITHIKIAKQHISLTGIILECAIGLQFCPAHSNNAANLRKNVCKAHAIEKRTTSYACYTIGYFNIGKSFTFTVSHCLRIFFTNERKISNSLEYFSAAGAVNVRTRAQIFSQNNLRQKYNKQHIFQLL